MRELANFECAFIAGGENDQLGTKLGMGMILGVTGMIVGSTIGYSRYDIIGGVLGAPIGMLVGAVGVPVALIGTGVAVAVAYRAIGFITNDDLGITQTEVAPAA